MVRTNKIAAAIGGLAFALLILPATPTTSSATPTTSSATYAVTSTVCTGPGSFAEALASAASNPGPDTISFTPGLVVATGTCPAGVAQPDGQWIAEVTDELTIEGNGATLKGYNIWISRTGRMTGLDGSCPRNNNVSTIAISPGLFRIGRSGQDNSEAKVVINNLKMFELESIASMFGGSSLTMDGVRADRIFSQRSCVRPAVHVIEGSATVVIKDNVWDTVVNWGVELGIGAISGSGSLTIEDSEFRDVFSSGFINWFDGDVKIVSSLMDDTGGIVHRGNGKTHVVNSLWRPTGDRQNFRDADRIRNNSPSDSMTFEASTILLAESVKPNTSLSSPLPPILHGTGAGKISFVGTAIGVNNRESDDPGLILGNESGATTNTGFEADCQLSSPECPDVWIQPVNGQDKAALETLIGSPLLTDPPGLPTKQLFLGTAEQRGMPLLGTVVDPGKLLDVIPDSQCTGLNKLINPIDFSCIVEDVLGNPRVDGNNKRNIGAIQLTLAPHLTVTGTGDGTVDLAWTRPKDPLAGAVSGYRIECSGTGVPTVTVDVTDPTVLATTVSGLFNGTEYSCTVVALAGQSSEPSPPSNEVLATPLAPTVAPIVSGSGGAAEVRLFWTEPDAGGRAGPPMYFVVYRPKGSTLWENGPGFFSGRTTLIPGLTDATTYEIGVTAMWPDGSVSPLGTSEATTSEPTVPPTTAPTTPPATTPPPGELPATGPYTVMFVLVSLVLVAAGSLAMVTSRRRGRAGARRL